MLDKETFGGDLAKKSSYKLIEHLVQKQTQIIFPSGLQDIWLQLFGRAIIKAKDAVLDLPLKTDPCSSPLLLVDRQGTQRSGKQERWRFGGFASLMGSLEEQWICKILYCFHKTVLHLFWDWSNQGFSFRRPDYAIKSGSPDHALPFKPERTRQDSTPLLMSHLRHQSHNIFPLFCIKHILSFPNVPILKIVTVIIKEWFGFFCTLQIIRDT